MNIFIKKNRLPLISGLPRLHQRQIDAKNVEKNAHAQTFFRGVGFARIRQPRISIVLWVIIPNQQAYMK